MFIVISGSTQVLLKCYDDRRQMMVLLKIVRNHNCCTRGKQRSDIPNLVFQNTTTFFTLKKNHTDLSLWHKGLCILDVFAAHRSNEFLNVMAIKNTRLSDSTNYSHLKIILKKIFEKNIKNEFQQYYAHEIEKSPGDTGLENVKINLKLPVIKEKLPQWLTHAIQKNVQHKTK